MNAEQQRPPRPARGTVLTLPPRGPQPKPGGRPAPPPKPDHAEPSDEPGYGHGV